MDAPTTSQEMGHHSAAGLNNTTTSALQAAPRGGGASLSPAAAVSGLADIAVVREFLREDLSETMDGASWAELRGYLRRRSNL